MFTRITLAAVAVTALALTVFGTGDALAGKGGNNTTETSYIYLDSSGDGATLAAASAPSLGTAVTFTSHAAGLAGWEYPMVAVWCYQGDALVYMQLDHPDANFVLGGGSSDWKTMGGDAECEAYLYAYGSKGWRESIRTLAGTFFFAAAP